MHKQDDYSTIDTKRRLAGPKTLDFSLEETNCTLTQHKHSPKNSTLSHDDEVIIGSRFNFHHDLRSDEKSSCGTERQRRLQKSLRNQGHSQFNESFQSFPSQDEKFMPHDISISEICHQMYDRSFISDRISLQRPFADLDTVRISERKSARDPSEQKAILFFKTKLYYKYLLLLKNNANNRRQAAVQLLYFVEINCRDKLMDAMSVWRNNAILSGTIPSDRSEDLMKKKKSRQTKSPKVPNLDLEASYTSVCLNPNHIYRYICAKRMFKGFKMMMKSRENKEKSSQFFYYNLLFKHMYRWIEFAKNKKSLVDNMTTRRSELDSKSVATGRYSNVNTHREIPTNRTNRDPLRVSYITDSELSYTLSRSYIAEYVEESAIKYRQLVLKRKAYYLLRSYQILQAKKKHLNTMLARVIKKNYMTIPFKFWHSKFKMAEKKSLATRSLVKAISKILKSSFAQFKDVRRILATKRRHIQAGIILKQQFAQDLKTAKPSHNISQISMIVDKENMNTSNIDVSAELGYKKLKSQLSQIFPSKENRRPGATESSFSSIGTNSSINQKKTFVSSMITDKENLNKILDSPTGISSGNQENMSPRNSFKEPRPSVVTKSVSFLKCDDPRKSIAITDNLNISSISPIHQKTKCHAQTSPIREEDLKKPAPKPKDIRKPTNPPKVTRNTKNKIPLAPNLNKTTIEHDRSDSRDTSMLGGLQNESLNISRISGKSSMNTSYTNPKYVPVGRRRSSSAQTNINVPIKSVPVPVQGGEVKAREPSLKEAQRDKYQMMIKDLEEHLNFLNKKLLDQKLMNKMLANVKTELLNESQLI